MRTSNPPVEIEIRPLLKEDQGWIKQVTTQFWGDDFVVVRGKIFYPWQLPGFAAGSGMEEILGLVTYQVTKERCEIITLNSFRKNQGVGSALVERVAAEALQLGCLRLLVATTNDNQRAIDFYQGRGFQLAAVQRGGVDRARSIKPSIPLLSREGIPIMDEWQLERILPRAGSSPPGFPPDQARQ